MSTDNNMDESHYFFTIASFAELAEYEGLDTVLIDLTNVLDIDKAMPHNINDQKRCYDLLQYLQNMVVNNMLDTVYESDQNE